MQVNDPPANGFPDQIINVLGNQGNNEQWAVVDLQGNVLVSTLPDASDSADTTGHVKHDYTYSVQGNRLSNTDVITNAEKEFRKKGSKGRRAGKGGKGGKGGCDDLADRLMRAMEAAVKDGDGDSDCTSSGKSSDTAYLLVKKPDDDDDGEPYCILDITTEADGSDAVERLRDAYDDWRDTHPCEKRPKRHERWDVVGVVGAIMTLLGVGYMAKKKRRAIISIEGDDYIAETEDDDNCTAETRSVPVYVLDFYNKARKFHNGIE